jgi:hypothetical protein
MHFAEDDYFFSGINRNGVWKLFASTAYERASERLVSSLLHVNAGNGP